MQGDVKKKNLRTGLFYIFNISSSMPHVLRFFEFFRHVFTFTDARKQNMYQSSRLLIFTWRTTTHFFFRLWKSMAQKWFFESQFFLHSEWKKTKHFWPKIGSKLTENRPKVEAYFADWNVSFCQPSLISTNTIAKCAGAVLSRVNQQMSSGDRQSEEYIDLGLNPWNSFTCWFPRLSK